MPSPSESDNDSPVQSPSTISDKALEKMEMGVIEQAKNASVQSLPASEGAPSCSLFNSLCGNPTSLDAAAEEPVEEEGEPSVIHSLEKAMIRQRVYRVHSPDQTRPSSLKPPTQCADRDRAADVADGARQVVDMLSTMNRNVVNRMMQAREAALNVHKAFPGGDQRFADAEDDDDYSDEDTVGTGANAGAGNTSYAADHEEQGEEFQINEDLVVEEEMPEDEGCVGLFDDSMDPEPHACLQRVIREYDGFDIIKLMDEANLVLLDRIRIVNWIRTLVRIEEVPPVDVIGRVKELLDMCKDVKLCGGDSDVLEGSTYLTPVIECDILLTALESNSSVGGQASSSASGTTGNGDLSSTQYNSLENDNDMVRQVVKKSIENLM